jgi:prolyl oligopeptidase
MFTFLLRSAQVLLFAGALGAAVRLPAESLTQPVAPVRPATDKYFGTSVTDNYRWMEDLKSPEVQNWMKGQAAYTKDYLSKLPGRDTLVKRIESLDNAVSRVAEVELHGAYYFYLKTNPTDQTPKLYVRDGLHATERLLVDPQVLGGPEGRFTISAFYPSPDGRFVAVEIAAGGSEEGVLLITGANDPRVDPVELFKMTARLQAATSSKNPVLLRVDSDAGHGIGSSKEQHDLITADQGV